MSKHLVIVESPAKSKTISKFLGPDYLIEASFGHIRDLPKHTLGVDIKENFEPKYVVMADKKKIIANLKAKSKKVDTIYLATDPDREGEAIAWHVLEALDSPKAQIKRIVFNEITEKAIKEAISSSRTLNMDLVDAQQARRVLDRLIGYKLSPIISSKIRRGLSAGRVQSVAVKIICDREKLIQAFIPKEYWVIDAQFETVDHQKITSKLFASPNSETAIEVETETHAKAIEKALSSAKYTVSEINKKQTQRFPYLPFITSTLQQDAARKLNWSSKKTMMIAQQLYEGVDIGGESTGLITYMRTDSTRVSDEAVLQAKGLIAGTYGKEYVSHLKPKDSTKKGVQDAHEAIRPSYVSKTPDQLIGVLETDQHKLYKLIWERFIASQMKPAQIENTQIIVKADSSPNYFFKTTGFVVIFDGFLKVYEESTDDSNATTEEGQSKLPKLTEGQPLTEKDLTLTQKFTTPPRRFTEASLVKEMEENGIGRPSTYAPTISTILDRNYIEKDKKALVPTELGMTVNDQLSIYFENIVDVAFTADMEQKLDNISENKSDWKALIKDFYSPFEEKIGIAKEKMEKVNTDKPTDKHCPNCASPMVIKSGRFGNFLACTNYPECKTTQSIVTELGVDCPECHRPMVEKKSRKGKLFYGCSGFPACKFAAWDKPIAVPCDTCQYPITVQKGAKTYCIKCTPPKVFEKKVAPKKTVPAKKVVKKASVKKTISKKEPVKKEVVKKEVVKKAVAKKVTAKKTVAKKTSKK